MTGGSCTTCHFRIAFKRMADGFGHDGECYHRRRRAAAAVARLPGRIDLHSAALRLRVSIQDAGTFAALVPGATRRLPLA